MKFSKILLTVMSAFVVILSVVYVYLVYFGIPRDAVSNTYDAIKNGDFPKLSRNSVEKTTAKFAMEALKNCSADKKSYDKDDMGLINVCLIEKYGKINVKKIDVGLVSQNEADANVTIEDGEKEYVASFKVVKIENIWKVDIRK